MALADETLSKLKRTLQTIFRIGTIAIKDSSGTVQTRTGAAGDASFADLQAKDLLVTANAHTVKLTGPAALGGDYTLTLPADDGGANEVLKTDGSGVLSWVAQASSPEGDLSYREAFTESSTVGDVTPTAPASGAYVKTIAVEVAATTATALSTITVGDETTADKFGAATDFDLTTVGTYILHPLVVIANTKKVQFTISKNASETFSGRVWAEVVLPG
jgi:hypothetical protein